MCAVTAAPAVETYQQRVNKQMRREIEEANTEWSPLKHLLPSCPIVRT